jgi:hypothetical protein
MMSCDRVAYLSSPGQSAPETLTLPSRLATPAEVAAALARRPTRPQTVRVHSAAGDSAVQHSAVGDRQADAPPPVRRPFRLTRSDAGVMLDRLARAWVRTYGASYAEAFHTALERHPALRRCYGGIGDAA